MPLWLHERVPFSGESPCLEDSTWVLPPLEAEWLQLGLPLGSRSVSRGSHWGRTSESPGKL